MDHLMPDKTGSTASSPAAFILYRPESKGGKELLFYNEEAWRVLNYPVPPEKVSEPSVDVSALCMKWKKMFDEGQEVSVGRGSGPEGGIIDIIKSGRRHYAIRAVVLSGTPSSEDNEKQYLFILERTGPEKMQLAIIFRNLGLNKREQEIVRLLLAGLGNKEIADSLGLSLNTIKGYLKLMSRKLGVSTRTGIIAAILGSKAGDKS